MSMINQSWFFKPHLANFDGQSIPSLNSNELITMPIKNVSMCDVRKLEDWNNGGVYVVHDTVTVFYVGETKSFLMRIGRWKNHHMVPNILRKHPNALVTLLVLPTAPSNLRFCFEANCIERYRPIYNNGLEGMEYRLKVVSGVARDYLNGWAEEIGLVAMEKKRREQEYLDICLLKRQEAALNQVAQDQIVLLIESACRMAFATKDTAVVLWQTTGSNCELTIKKIEVAYARIESILKSAGIHECAVREIATNLLRIQHEKLSNYTGRRGANYSSLISTLADRKEFDLKQCLFHK